MAPAWFGIALIVVGCLAVLTASPVGVTLHGFETRVFRREFRPVWQWIWSFRFVGIAFVGLGIWFLVGRSL